MNRRSMFGSSVEPWLFGGALRCSLLFHNISLLSVPPAVLNVILFILLRESSLFLYPYNDLILLSTMSTEGSLPS